MRYLLLTLLLFITFLISAKDTTQYNKHFEWNITTGGALSSFQDLKYSAIHWSGLGITGGLDFKWQKKDIHSLGFDGVYSDEKPKTFNGFGNYKVYRGQLYYYYLHPIKQQKDYKLFIGTKIDGLDVNWHINEDLYNNASYLIYGFNFKIFSEYQQQLNEKWGMSVQLGFQLFSLMEEGISFGYAAPQETLENGDYNYNQIEFPLFFTPFWDYLSIETNINFTYSKRWTFSYKWRMQQSYIVKNYHMTQGYSALVVSFSIISKDKAIKLK